jgi:AraC family transcriptional regulator, transcriptional activator FtrA
MGKRHLVATLVGEGVAEFEMAVACEIFGYDRSEQAGGRPWYRHVLAAAGPDVRTMHGMRVDPEPGLAALRKADTIVVCPWKDTRVTVPDAVLDALRAAHRRGARILSFCSGAFVLAATGLLDGRRATTHWAYVDEFAQRFPEVKLDPGVLYVDEGDILTAAGTAAGIDLCLHVVRLDYGAETANAVARRLVMPPHRDGGQAQYIHQPVPACTDDPIGRVLDWALERLDEPLSVDVLAERAAMTPRTFARRFGQATGTTPHQWLLTNRVLLAQRLLETTDDPVELIARACGFGTAAALRVHFQRVTDTAPLAYRRCFRSEAG